ncbi:MAG: hypothetical protein ACE5GW_00280 [Planctomycetota bacterium]
MVSVCRIVVPASSANIGPGFDSIGIAVGLSITVTVDAAPPGGFAVSITGEGSGILPEDGRNWVLKSAREIAGDATDRAAWEMHSEIPVARGLGSSASARAAGLAAGYMLRDGALPPPARDLRGGGAHREPPRQRRRLRLRGSPCRRAGARGRLV